MKFDYKFMSYFQWQFSWITIQIRPWMNDNILQETALCNYLSMFLYLLTLGYNYLSI